ncbi:YbaB/EbfC family nucleoid-associated protein [Rhodoferax sp. 4810]|uniref:Nucleoid-associated protein HUK38_11235 n=1 Tax=Thiospirillum jenense TaxID=1653858 RepID=A0A839HI70_9GAMM|nr:YbaB/EbfC family nucleoid-associated protein [Thiospirillum jenense]MBB1075418.1 YbaB/EbfC family nucleoid-associated protein [Rhodoferax jenense]MBB1126796.1 YbaB/EbfC family nucleoid-associated protein [Thiospirillum jenense]
MMKGGLGSMLKQAQKMQQELQKSQERLAQEEVTGESGGGMVRVTMTGGHEVKRVELDPSLLTDDKDMLEDLIAAAVNDAVNRVKSRMQQTMSELTAGIPLPPGMKLPF